MPEKSKPSALEFERFPSPTEIQLSTVFSTPAGDDVRAIETVGGALILTRVGRSDGPLETLLVKRPGGASPKAGWGWLWDVGKAVGKKVIKEVMDSDKNGGGGGTGGGGGGAMTCTTTTETLLDKTGRVISITTTTTCGAQ